jgi:hypothetical protein
MFVGSFLFGRCMLTIDACRTSQPRLAGVTILKMSKPETSHSSRSTNIICDERIVPSTDLQVAKAMDDFPKTKTKITIHGRHDMTWIPWRTVIFKSSRYLFITIPMDLGYCGNNRLKRVEKIHIRINNVVTGKTIVFGHRKSITSTLYNEVTKIEYHYCPNEKRRTRFYLFLRKNKETIDSQSL